MSITQVCVQASAVIRRARPLSPHSVALSAGTTEAAAAALYRAQQRTAASAERAGTLAGVAIEKVFDDGRSQRRPHWNQCRHR
jgi:hypothetical protein